MVRRKINFKCTCCGACCRGIPNPPPPGFEELDRGDGVCKNLNEETNLCKVYDHRPDVCNSEIMAERSGMSRLDYFRECAKMCKYLQEKEKYDNTKTILTIH